MHNADCFYKKAIFVSFNAFFSKFKMYVIFALDGTYRANCMYFIGKVYPKNPGDYVP